jgi:hypothetical protein
LEDLLPRNGEINKEFGVFKNLCCGVEIVIRENATFPACAVHTNLPTEWKSIAMTDTVLHASQFNPKKNIKPAA